MPLSTYQLMKISMKAAVWDREQTIVGRGIYNTEQMKEVITTIEAMEDALLKALPYVTDAIDCPAFKQGFVKAEAEAIVKTIKLIQ